VKKIISVVGARPNFMKVAPIHRAFKKYEDVAKHIIVHTGQHYDAKMSDAFFQDLEMPSPDYFLGVGSGSHAVQTAKIMVEFEKVLIEENPDMVLVVGDVNSTIACSLTAVKMGIKTAHVEAGLRSYDRAMPEEINRLATDAISDYYFITEKSGKENLLREGYDNEKIFLTGNNMIDSQVFALEKSKGSMVLKNLGLEEKSYVLLTVHRPSNVDNKEQLEILLDTFDLISKTKKLIFPMHPRTIKNLKEFGLYSRIEDNSEIILMEALGYIDFLALMKNSFFVMTDSGGIQEETTALGVPCLTLRDSTERPITTEIGTNILVVPSKENILKNVNNYLDSNFKKGELPELWDGRAAERMAEIIINKILVN